MFKALSQLEIPKALIQTVKNVYKYNIVKIKVGNKTVQRVTTRLRYIQNTHLNMMKQKRIEKPDWKKGDGTSCSNPIT